ncbi:hypothetical protein J5226_23330 [Lysobacter sp. K5869]|uniref:hypothetical protein n=1 Tax=Lysobacter sp. K5869 TaxID=2820808 RepID=UPI001C062222|nr:hypothetical protein [Lysobacter sp. K5869]QWP76479.1 hypothetical protein J5226_23330 [Lysobacter sp. K5869]
MYAVAVRWSEHYFVEPRRTSQAGDAFVESTERRGTFGSAPAPLAPAVRMERDHRAAAHERADKSASAASRRAPFGLHFAVFAGAPA